MADEFEQENKDLTHCSVCLLVYDSETRRPKYLPCSHTACLSCLQVILEQETVKCPLCRESWDELECDAADLPNNIHALHILQMKEKIKNDEMMRLNQTLVDNPRVCLTCRSAAKVDCITNAHSFIEVANSSTLLKNLQMLIALKNYFIQMKKERKTKLTEAIGMRKNSQKYLAQVSQVLQHIVLDVKSKEDHNNLCLSELTNLLESDERATVPYADKEDELESPCLPELLELLGYTIGDTIETLKEKLARKFNKSYEGNLKSAAVQEKKLSEYKKTIVSVQLFDQDQQQAAAKMEFTRRPEENQPANSNRTPAEIQTWAESYLLSVLAFSLSDKIPKPATTSNPPDSQINPTAGTSTSYQGDSNQRMNQTLTNKTRRMWCRKCYSDAKEDCYTNSHSMVEFRNGWDSARPNKKIKTEPESETIIPMGWSNSFKLQLKFSPIKGFIAPGLTFQIESSSFSPYSNFIRQLGLTTLQSPEDRFPLKITKVVPGVYIIAQFTGKTIIPYMPFFNAQQIEKQYRASKFGDVGVSQVKTDASKRVIGWNLIFPLEQFENPAALAPHVNAISPAFTLGRISDRSDLDRFKKIASVNEIYNWVISLTSTD